MLKNTIVEISSILQCQKYPKGRKLLFPQLETAKTYVAKPRTSINEKLKKIKTFLKKGSGKSHSAENPNEFSMIAKLLIFCKNLGEFDKNQIKSHSTEKTPVIKKFRLY